MENSRNNQRSKWRVLGSPPPGMGRRTRKPLGIKVNKMNDGLDAVNGYFPESDQESEYESQSADSASLVEDYDERVNEEEIIEERVEDSGQDDDDIIDDYFDKEVFKIETNPRRSTERSYRNETRNASGLEDAEEAEDHDDSGSQGSQEIELPKNNQSYHNHSNHDHSNHDQYNQNLNNHDNFDRDDENSQEQDTQELNNQDHYNHNDHCDQHHDNLNGGYNHDHSQVDLHQTSVRDAAVSTETNTAYTDRHNVTVTVGTNTSNIRYTSNDESRQSLQNHDQFVSFQRGTDFKRKKSLAGRKRSHMNHREHDYDDGDSERQSKRVSIRHGRYRKRSEMYGQDYYDDDDAGRPKRAESKRHGRYRKEPEPVACYDPSSSEDERAPRRRRNAPRSVQHGTDRYSRTETNDVTRRKLLHVRSETKPRARPKKAHRRIGLPKKRPRKSVQFAVSTPSSDVVENADMGVQPQDEDIDESPERTRRSWMQQKPATSTQKPERVQSRSSSLAKATPMDSELRESRRKSGRKSVQFAVTAPDNFTMGLDAEMEELSYTPVSNEVQATSKNSRRASRRSSLKRDSDANIDRQPSRQQLNSTRDTQASAERVGRRPSQSKHTLDDEASSERVSRRPSLSKETPNAQASTERAARRLSQSRSMSANQDSIERVSRRQSVAKTTPLSHPSNEASKQVSGKQPKRRKSSKLNYRAKRKSNLRNVKAEVENDVAGNGLASDAEKENGELIEDIMTDDIEREDNASVKRGIRKSVFENQKAVRVFQSSRTPNLNIETPRSILHKKNVNTPKSLNTPERRLSIQPSLMDDDSPAPLPVSKWVGVSPHLPAKFVPESPMDIPAPNTPSVQGTPRSTGIIRAAIRRSIQETPLGQLPTHSGFPQSTPMANLLRDRSPLPRRPSLVPAATGNTPVWNEDMNGHNTLPGRSDSDCSMPDQPMPDEEPEEPKPKPTRITKKKRGKGRLNPKKNNAAKKNKTATQNRICGLDISDGTRQKILNEAGAQEGPRRGNRTRIAPVRYWKTKEYVDYERRASGGLVVKEVVRAEKTPVHRPKRPAARRKTVKNAAKPPISSESESENMFEEVNPVQMVRWDNDELIEMRVVHTPAMLNLAAPHPLPDGTELKNILLHKYFSQRLFSAGYFVLQPKAEKGLQLVENDTMLFIIARGLVDVTIEDSTLRLGKNCTFFVPSGSVYNIKNILEERAELHFIQIKG